MKNQSPARRHLALFAPLGVLLLAGCGHAPLGRSTAEYATPLETGHTFVLPVASSTNLAPVYPLILRRNATEGFVEIDCVIDETGRVVIANVATSSHQAFDRPTVAAVRSWTFQPGTRDGVPTTMRLSQLVEFRMEK